MSLVFLLTLIGLLLSVFGSVPAPIETAARVIAAFLFPGSALLVLFSERRTQARDLLLGPALSPLVLGGIATAALFAGQSVPVWVNACVLASGLVVVVARFGELAPSPHEDENFTRLVWWTALGFAVVVALVLVPSEWRRMTSDAWFHQAVVHEIDRAGLPPQDPYFAGLPLQYFWFFHTVLLGIQYATGWAPAEGMAALNILAAFLVVPAVVRLLRALGFQTRTGVWAGIVFMLGMGGLFWVWWPLKMGEAFVGQVRGMEEIRSIFNLRPFLPETTAMFSQFLSSSSFFMRKFLVGTAASYSLLLGLVAAGAAFRFRAGAATSDGALLVVATLGATLFHIILGGVSLAALAAAAGLAFLLGWGPRMRNLTSAILIGVGLALCIPYVREVTHAKTSDNLFPLGLSPRYWISLPATFLGTGLLAYPAIRELWPARRGEIGMFLLWLGVSALYCLFARLPGPNQFDKPPMILHIPLALTAGVAIPHLWKRWASRPALRSAFAAFLVIFLVPENALQWASFYHDSVPPAMSQQERDLYRWIGESTPRDAVFIDSNERVQVLVRGPRRQYWGWEPYADQWGYDVAEKTTRQRIRNAVYGAEPVTRELLSPLRKLRAPVFVVVRGEDAPGAGDHLTRDGLFRPVFREGSYQVFRLMGT